MTDDLPLDLDQVAADDAAIEALRTRAVTPDPALALLRQLLDDVDADLPSSAPVGRGSTVLSLAGEQTPERRLARNGAVVVLFTAGIVSLSGVAAASVMVPPGNPLHGLGETVRSVAAAVAPPKEVEEPDAGDSAGRAAGSGVLPSPTRRPPAPHDVPALARASSMPGAGISAAARSHAAERRVAARQDAAARAAARGAEAPESRPVPKDSSGDGKSSARRAPAEQPVIRPERVTRPAPAAPRAERRVLPLDKPKAQLSRTPSMKPRA